MPLLEVVQTRQISASIRLTDTTANQVDQYAAFIRASADDVVEQALAYVFTKDRDFQEFLKSPDARKVTPTLRIRKAVANEVAEPTARKPVPSPTSPAQTVATTAGSKA
jgi:hypothetical protein